LRIAIPCCYLWLCRGLLLLHGLLLRGLLVHGLLVHGLLLCGLLLHGLLLHGLLVHGLLLRGLLLHGLLVHGLLLCGLLVHGLLLCGLLVHGLLLRGLLVHGLLLRGLLVHGLLLRGLLVHGLLLGLRLLLTLLGHLPISLRHGDCRVRLAPVVACRFVSLLVVTHTDGQPIHSWGHFLLTDRLVVRIPLRLLVAWSVLRCLWLGRVSVVAVPSHSQALL